MKRFEVWLVQLDPTIGSEIKKTRPAIIVSPDELNKHLATVIVVPLTTGRAYPFRVQTRVQGVDGVAAIDQLRTVDKRRLIKRLTTVRGKTLLATLWTLAGLMIVAGLGFSSPHLALMFGVGALLVDGKSYREQAALRLCCAAAGLLLLLWLLPAATWFPLITRIRNIAEHAVVPDNDDPLRNARTTYAGPLMRLFLAPYWVNYHTEHHLHMWVPCYKLPKMHRLLKARGLAERMEIQPDYWTVLAKASARPART